MIKTEKEVGIQMLSGEKIQRLGNEQNLSQKELAEKLEVSRQAIAKWETNRGIPDIENLKRIAQLFNVSIDYLVDEEESIQDYVMIIPIDIAQYPMPKGNALREDQVVLKNYPNAQSILELYRQKRMTNK